MFVELNEGGAWDYWLPAATWADYHVYHFTILLPQARSRHLCTNSFTWQKSSVQRLLWLEVQLQIHMLSHVQGHFFFHQTLTTVVSLSVFLCLSLFFFMAPALASSKVASQNFPSENISQNLFSLPHQKICLLFHISLAILHIYSWKEKKSILHFEMFQFWGEHSLEVHPVQRSRNFFTKYLFLISPSHP